MQIKVCDVSNWQVSHGTQHITISPLLGYGFAVEKGGMRLGEQEQEAAQRFISLRVTVQQASLNNATPLRQVPKYEIRNRIKVSNEKII